MASFPVLTRYFKESKDQMVALALLMLKIMLWLACPLVLGGVVLARPIIFCLYGSEYLPAVTAFQLLIFSVLTVYTSTPFSSSLLAAQKYNQYFYSVLVGAIVNIVANLYLIPHYSLIGAAVATLISEILVWSLLYYYYSRHVARVPAGKNLLAFGSCAGLMAVLVYSIGLIWPLKALLGAGFYLLVSFGLRLITWDEIRTVFWKES
jgi:O-antigen/teichoic acid export membrane protein